MNEKSISFDWEPEISKILIDTTSSMFSSNSNGGIISIDVLGAYQKYRTKKAMFIDARDKWDYNDGHIPGAINIPEYKFDPNQAVIKTLEKSLVYIVYCSGNDCDVSKKLAHKLIKNGFRKVSVFIGGWNEWLAFGYPIKVEHE